MPRYTAAAIDTIDAVAFERYGSRSSLSAAEDDARRALESWTEHPGKIVRIDRTPLAVSAFGVSTPAGLLDIEAHVFAH